jgi:hypothetical protein
VRLFAAGERIRVTMNGPADGGSKRVSNTDLYTLAGFDEHGDLKLDNGMTLARDFGHLDYGYTTTSYAAQGKTVQHVILVESALSFGAASREQFNVSIGRGRVRYDLVTHDKGELFEAIARSSRRYSALDLVHAPDEQFALEQEAEERAEKKEPVTPKWQLPAVMPPVEREPMKEQLGQRQNVPAKAGWMLPVVMLSEDERLKEQLGQKKKLPENLEWKLPATLPSQDPEPEIEEIEPDLDEDLGPRMLP